MSATCLYPPCQRRIQDDQAGTQPFCQSHWLMTRWHTRNRWVQSTSTERLSIEAQLVREVRAGAA